MMKCDFLNADREYCVTCDVFTISMMCNIRKIMSDKNSRRS